MGAIMLGLQAFGNVMQGRAQRQEYDAQAEAAEVNAQQMYLNAKRQQEAGFTNAENSAINRDVKRQNLMRSLAASRANIGASGITLSGSALKGIADSKAAVDAELAMDAYNDRQRTEGYMNEAANLFGQGNVYRENAVNLRKAGKRAYVNGLIDAGFTLASGLYGGRKTKKVKANNATIKDKLNIFPELINNKNEYIEPVPLNNENTSKSFGWIGF